MVGARRDSFGRREDHCLGEEEGRAAQEALALPWAVQGAGLAGGIGPHARGRMGPGNVCRESGDKSRTGVPET